MDIIEFPYIPAWWVSIALLLAAVGVFATNKPLSLKIIQAVTRVFAAALYIIYSVIQIEGTHRSNQSRAVFVVLFTIDFVFYLYCYFRRKRQEQEIARLVHRINTEKQHDT
jgi:hypothetical protein